MQNKMAGLQNKCRIKMRDYRKRNEDLKKLTVSLKNIHRTGGDSSIEGK